jgi:hypothetical protein
MKKITLTFLITLFFLNAYAYEKGSIYKWEGSQNTKWEDGRNWVNQSGTQYAENSPPSNGSSWMVKDYAIVIIENTSPNQPVISEDVEITSLILRDGAKLEISDGINFEITHEYEYDDDDANAPDWNKVENNGAILIGKNGKMEVLKYFDNAQNGIITSNGTYIVHRLINNFGSIFVPPSGQMILDDALENSKLISNYGNIDINGNVNNKTAGEITIKSDKNGTGSLITNGTITNNGNGTMTVERWIDNHDTDVTDGNDNKWHLVSSPVTDEKFGAFYGHFLNYYEVAGGNFKAEKDPSIPLEVGRGYVARYDGKLPNSVGNIIIFDDGTFNTGDKTISLETGVGNTWFDLPQNFNLIGNPFPSNLSWDDVYFSSGNSNNVTPFLYYYNDNSNGIGEDTNMGGNVTNGWIVYEANDPSDGSYNPVPENYISSGQGFGVVLKSNPTNNNILIVNSARTHSKGNGFGKKSNTKTNYSFTLMAESNNLIDKSKFEFNKNATADYDEMYDAYKFNSFGNSPVVSFLSDDGKKLSVCRESESESVNLGFNMSVSGEVTFSLNNVNDFSGIILEDKQKNTFTDLTKNTYSFNHSSNDEETGRFTLHFKKETLSEVEETVGVKIYSNNNRIFIQPNKVITDAIVNIYNTNGQLVLSKQYSTLEKEEIETNLNRGIYIIEINSNEDRIVTKINLNTL